MTLSPRQKWIAAALAALAIPAVALAQGASASHAARAVLAVTTIAALAAWYVRGQPGSKFKAAPRLQLVQRVGLSQRSGVALIEVDGRPYLVVHGDGFAKVTPTRRAHRVSLSLRSGERVGVRGSVEESAS